MESYLQHLNSIKNCIEANDYIIRLIIMDVEYMFENVHPIDHEHCTPVSFYFKSNKRKNPFENKEAF